MSILIQTTKNNKKMNPETKIKVLFIVGAIIAAAGLTLFWFPTAVLNSGIGFAIMFVGAVLITISLVLGRRSIRGY